MTETDTRMLLENDMTAAGKPLRDHLMIKDHYAAFQYIQEQAKQKRKLSLEFIQEIGGLYHNEPLIKIFTEDRTEYIDVLNETEEQADLELFQEFIGRQETKFLRAEISKHKKMNKGFMLMF